MTFHVGQKVVCVRDAWNLVGSPPIAVPRAGLVYIIRTIEPADTGPGFRFHWLINPKYHYAIGGYTEAQFTQLGLDGLPNFLPLIERKTDISAFTALLDPNNHKPLEREPHQKPLITSDA